MIRLLMMVALVFAVGACGASSAVLPTTGRVYRESMDNGTVRLSPATNVELIVERINVCDQKMWPPGESSTTGIDSHIVVSDSEGYFHLPPKTVSDVCSRVVLNGTAISPYTHSISGRVAKSPMVGNPALYKALDESDVVITAGAQGTERIQELSADLNQAVGSYAVTETMRAEVISRYFAEICELRKNFPRDSSSLYEKANSALGRTCD